MQYIIIIKKCIETLVIKFHFLCRNPILMQAAYRELDETADDAARFERALRGVFAGNIFDLGAADSARQFEEQGVRVSALKKQIK